MEKKWSETRSLKLEERVCSVCSSGEVEDEYHLLSKCNVFSDIRVDYINNIMRNNADFMLERNTEFFVKGVVKEKDLFISVMCVLGTLYTFLFAISVYKVTL